MQTQLDASGLMLFAVLSMGLVAFIGVTLGKRVTFGVDLGGVKAEVRVQ